MPTAFHRLYGNPQRLKLEGREPIAPGTLDQPPDWLTERQKDGWRYAIANAPKRVLKKIDRGPLAVWVVAEDLHMQATDTLNSVPYARDIVSAVLRKQSELMLLCASLLGFSPKSRRHLGR